MGRKYPGYARKVTRVPAATRQILRANLVRLLKERHWSQRHLAKESDVARPTIARLISGDYHDVDTGTVCALAEAFGKQYWHLMTPRHLQSRWGEDTSEDDLIPFPARGAQPLVLDD